MALIAAGTCVGYVESDYEFQGRKGRSRRLTVSTGESTEEISISEDLAMALGPRDLAKLSEFGRPVVCKVKASANATDQGGARLGVRLVDLEFVRMADLAVFGYVASVYVEEPVGPPPTRSKNGAPATAGV